MNEMVYPFPTPLGKGITNIPHYKLYRKENLTSTDKTEKKLHHINQRTITKTVKQILKEQTSILQIERSV